MWKLMRNADTNDDVIVWKEVDPADLTGRWKIRVENDKASLYIEIIIKRFFRKPAPEFVHEYFLSLNSIFEYTNCCGRGQRVPRTDALMSEIDYLTCRLKEVEDYRNKQQKVIAMHEERLRKFNHAMLAQSLKTAYMNGHGSGDIESRLDTYPGTGELLWVRYLCKEAREVMGLINEGGKQ